jgi:predicted transcriptional regulator
MDFPSVSDHVFEAVLSDIIDHPATSMKSTAHRTGCTYLSVTHAVRYMVSEGSVVRRRVGQVRGLGSTYANLAVVSRFT